MKLSVIKSQNKLILFKSNKGIYKSIYYII